LRRTTEASNRNSRIYEAARATRRKPIRELESTSLQCCRMMTISCRRYRSNNRRHVCHCRRSSSRHCRRSSSRHCRRSSSRHCRRTKGCHRSMYLQSDHLLTRRWQQGLTPGRPCTSVLILPQYGSVQVTLIGQQSTFQGRSDKVLERQAVGAQLLLDALSRFNISAPVPFPATRSGTIPVRYQLDRNKQVAYSEFLRRSGMRLGDFIRLLRGERAADTSPNKALWVPTEVPSWRSYRFAPQWEDIVQHGVVPEWREVPPAQSTPPPNHGSARRALNMVVKNIRKGQDEDLSHSRH
jgi:hypothetical protein